MISVKHYLKAINIKLLLCKSSVFFYKLSQRICLQDVSFQKLKIHFQKHKNQLGHSNFLNSTFLSNKIAQANLVFTTRNILAKGLYTDFCIITEKLFVSFSLRMSTFKQLFVERTEVNYKILNQKLNQRNIFHKKQNGALKVTQTTF